MKVQIVSLYVSCFMFLGLSEWWKGWGFIATRFPPGLSFNMKLVAGFGLEPGGENRFLVWLKRCKGFLSKFCSFFSCSTPGHNRLPLVASGTPSLASFPPSRLFHYN